MALATSQYTTVTAQPTALPSQRKRFTVPFDISSADITVLETAGIVTIGGRLNLDGIDGATFLYLTLSAVGADPPENP